MNNNLLIAFVALTAIALIAQAGLLLAFFLFAKKSYDSMRADFEQFRDSAMPLFNASKVFFERISPHIEPVTADFVKTMSSVQSISADAAEIAKKMRAEVDTVRASADEVIGRFKEQAVRLDAMTTTVLNSADRVGGFLQNAVSAPARQVAGVMAAAKAVVETLKQRPDPAVRRAQGNGSSDHETFI